MKVFKSLTKKGRKQLRVEVLWKLAFRLSNSRMSLAVDEENETLVLLPPSRPRLTEVEKFKKAAMFE